MTDRIRVGIIGAGTNTRDKHLPGLQAIDGVSVEVVCNRSRESGERVAEEFNIPRVADHWEEVANDPEIDAVMIGTWPYLHAPATLAALSAGKHVLCEARMAMNAAEAMGMLEASRARPDQVAQIVPSPMTLPWDRFLKRNLDEGLIGDLLAVDVFANSGAFRDPERPMTWREDRELSGLNTMMLGIYYEALARWTGHARSVRAQGQITVPYRTTADGVQKQIRIPDHLDVFGELENGATYHIRCSQVTGACPTPNDFILYGSTGTLRLNLSDAALTLHRPDQDPETLEVPESEREHWRVEEEFIGAIRGEESVRLTPFDEGLKYMEFTQAVADELAVSP